MIIIVGLGNPGKKYQNTWHNVGFRVLDKLQKDNQFSGFYFSKKASSKLSQRRKSEKEKIILAEPQTFMNNSGQAVKKIIKQFKAPIKNFNLIVVHDDADLPIGKIKISKNKRSGGHKGVQSIIDSLKTKNFIRIRIGINPTADKDKNEIKAGNIVLNKIKKEERAVLEKAIEKSVEAIKVIIDSGPEKAMNIFNS